MLPACSGPVRGVSADAAPRAQTAKPATKRTSAQPKIVLEPVNLYGLAREGRARSVYEICSAVPNGLLSPVSAGATLQVAHYRRAGYSLALADEHYSADAYRACLKAQQAARKMSTSGAEVRVVVARGWALAAFQEGDRPVVCAFRAAEQQDGAPHGLADGAVLQGDDALGALKDLASR